MALSPLHRYLREATAPAHRRLETLVGALTDRAAYRRYVVGLHAMRAPVESALAHKDRVAFGDWHPTRIADALAADLADLGLQAAAKGPPIVLCNHSEHVGTLYVLEGSNLGARLLLRSARHLGLTEQFGARHLHRQAEAHGNWHKFLALLEQDRGVDAEAAAQAANRIFEAGHSAMQAVQDAAA